MLIFENIDHAKQHFEAAQVPILLPIYVTIDNIKYQLSGADTVNETFKATYKNSTTSDLIIIEYNSDGFRYESMEKMELQESIDVGFECDAIVHGFNGNQPIHCKIDTGADMCSMHGTNITINNNIVQFVFNDRKYNVGLSGQQQVKQAGSEPTSRPIIKINLTIQGQVLRNVECNISDRTDMIPLLIGKNVLSQHDFIINTQQASETTNV